MPASGINFTASRIRNAQIAEATSQAAMKIVLERIALKKDDKLSDFLTDAYATVGVAYHRAAGVCQSAPKFDPRIASPGDVTFA